MMILQVILFTDDDDDDDDDDVCVVNLDEYGLVYKKKKKDSQ